MPFTIPGTQITIPDNVDPTAYILSLGQGVGQQLAGSGQPQQQAAAPTDTGPSKRDAALAPYIQKYGAPIGQSNLTYTPTAADIKAGTVRPTGFTQYILGDGSTVEVDDSGQVQNFKQSTSAAKNGGWGTLQPIKSTDAQGNEVTTYYGTDPSDRQLKPVPGMPTSTIAAPTRTPQETLAASGGPLLVGQGAGATTWVKNPTPEDGRGPYIQTDASLASQDLATKASAADTAYKQAQAKVQEIDAQIKADPTNIALQQQKDAAAIAASQAQSRASATADAKNKWDLQAAQQLQPGKVAQQGVDLQSAQVKLQQAQLDLANNPTDTALKNAYTAAQTNYQNALAAETTAKTNAPTMLTTGTGRVEQYWDPSTQSIQTRQNPNWAPTDPGAMTAALTQQTNAYSQQLQQKVASGQITGDQAQSQLNQYVSDVIEPQKADIAAAQAKAQSALQYQQAQTGYEQGLTAMLPADLAERASNDAQSRAVAMMPYMVNASAATTPGITAGKNGFPVMNPQQIMANATYSLPNLQEIGRQGAAAALAQISPTAAMHAQMPGPPAQPPVGGFDVNSMLNLNAYGGGQASGAPAAGAPAVAPAAGPALPPGAPVAGMPAQPAAPQPDWVSIMASLNQDRAAQSRQAQVGAIAPPTPGMFNPYYQQQYPGMGAGMPATGPVAGAGMGDLAGYGAGYGLNLSNLVPWGQYQPA